MTPEQIKAQTALAIQRKEDYYKGMPKPTNEKGWEDIRKKAIDQAHNSGVYYINVLIENKRIEDLKEILEELNEENDKSTIGARGVIERFLNSLKLKGGKRRTHKRRHNKRRTHKRRHTRRH